MALRDLLGGASPCPKLRVDRTLLPTAETCAVDPKQTKAWGMFTTAEPVRAGLASVPDRLC
jgi:hypothetical protein